VKWGPRGRAFGKSRSGEGHGDRGEFSQLGKGEGRVQFPKATIDSAKLVGQGHGLLPNGGKGKEWPLKGL